MDNKLFESWWAEDGFHMRATIGISDDLIELFGEEKAKKYVLEKFQEAFEKRMEQTLLTGGNPWRK